MYNVYLYIYLTNCISNCIYLFIYLSRCRYLSIYLTTYIQWFIPTLNNHLYYYVCQKCRHFHVITISPFFYIIYYYFVGKMTIWRWKPNGYQNNLFKTGFVNSFSFSSSPFFMEGREKGGEITIKHDQYWQIAYTNYFFCRTILNKKIIRKYIYFFF